MLFWHHLKRAMAYGPQVRRVAPAALSVVMIAVFGVLLARVPVRGDAQADNAYWQAYAQTFAHEGAAARGPAAVVKLEQGFIAEQSKPALLRDIDMIAPLETFSQKHFDLAAAQKNAQNCLAQAIYYEARSEPLSGQLAVAQVVLNRVRHQAYPNTICKVVYEGASRATGCQFTFTCDGSLAVPPHGASWARSQYAAMHAMLGMSDVTIGRATHYHTVAVRPVWSGTLLRTANIGTHIFYRFPSRREKALMGDAA